MLNDPTSDHPRLRRIFLFCDAYLGGLDPPGAWRGRARCLLLFSAPVDLLAGRDSVHTVLAEAGLPVERVPHAETP